MTLRADFSFTGYIRVEMELVRPITVAGVNSAKGDIFYLPKNTVKAIYLTSSNTASQVVNALLQKVSFGVQFFNVTPTLSEAIREFLVV